MSAAFHNSTALETAFLVGLVVAAAIVLWTYQFVSSRFDMHSGYGDAENSADMLDLQRVQSAANLRGAAQLSSADKVDGDVDERDSGNADRERRTKGGEGIGQGGYPHFLQVARDLAALPPDETLRRLEDDDPFQTRAFDAALLERETGLGRVLDIEEIRQLFPCPSDGERVTLPDVRVEQKAKDFRDGKRGTFLFFQHLRKAG